MKDNKRKTYVEPAIFILSTIIILITVLGPVLMFFALLYTEDFIIENNEDIATLIFLAFIFLVCDIVLLVFMAPRGLASITLYDDHVTWRAPFKKSVSLKYDDIKFAGVDHSNFRNDMLVEFKEAETLYISTYIYLSVLQYYPRRGKEFKTIYNEDGIIMFKYTEKLCPALVEKLPSEVGKNLRDFDKRIKSLNGKK